MEEPKVKEVKKVLEYIKDHCPSQLGAKEYKGIGYCARGECLECWCNSLDIE